MVFNFLKKLTFCSANILCFFVSSGCFFFFFSLKESKKKSQKNRPFSIGMCVKETGWSFKSSTNPVEPPDPDPRGHRWDFSFKIESLHDGREDPKVMTLSWERFMGFSLENICAENKQQIIFSVWERTDLHTSVTANKCIQTKNKQSVRVLNQEGFFLVFLFISLKSWRMFPGTQRS